MPHEKFLKPYNPKEAEGAVYALWEQSGFFNPDNLPDIASGARKIPYSIVLPPPNVTGTLHMGHAAMLAIQDILIRFNRMRGKKTLWLPGTDHAAIATQSRVEGDIYKKEKKTRHDLGREEFLKRVEQFTKESHDTIVNQIKRMGSSVDWSREAYTLDKERNIAVNTAFKRMYDANLIYRGARIVNWDPKMQTTVSDDEIEYTEQTTKFYYLKYGPFIIGTARPETKFGDKYVVMHPDDTRYKKYKDGQKIELEWINGPITATVVKDAAIDMEFGTGVMTITPAHSAIDFEIAERHALDKEQIIDWNGKLLSIAGEFAGQHISKVRAAIVEKLEKKGLVEKIDEKYSHSIAVNSRGGGIIEPQIKEQWFVDVEKPFTVVAKEKSALQELNGKNITLKEVMRFVVEQKKIKIIPERFEKVYFHWIDNLRPWCISRQIWFGHRIPVWYHEPKCVPIQGKETEFSQCIEIVVSENEPVCEHCNAKYTQDSDTLDTWFSSGLWTFSTLGWPQDTEDLQTYHPTDVLETGHDILFFWVARMILMTAYLLGDIPFKTVYLHGLVRDGQGRKMSKSLGNTLDPLLMIEKYGADATRLSLIIGATDGNDLPLSEDKIRGYKHFANKLWNISRFVLTHTEHIDIALKPLLEPKDEERLNELRKTVADVTNHIETYRFDLAADSAYHYVWHTFADVILEESKPILNGENTNAKQSAQWTLRTILNTSLALLHPFMPFVTEEIWSLIPRTKRNLLMVEPWPLI